MPIYEYQCSNPDCRHEFDELQSMSEPPLLTCPKCGKDTLQKLIGSGAGLIFKGSGFYLTDYKNKKTSGEPVKQSDTKESAKKEGSTKEGSAKEGSTKEGSGKESIPPEKKGSDKQSGASKKSGNTESKSAETKKSVSKSSENTKN